MLDQHGLIYAYGNLSDLEDALRDGGLVPGELPEVPVPHEHRYQPALDEQERALVEEVLWRRVLPLQDSDFTN